MARVHFLNVEDGDCSIIQHENGDVTMIDVCSAKEPEEELIKGMKTFSDASESLSIPKGNFHQKYHPENPVSYLQDLGVTSIFRYIQTHPDMDHMDGLQYIAGNFSILNFGIRQIQKSRYLMVTIDTMRMTGSVIKNCVKVIPVLRH